MGNEIGIEREALGHALKTYQLSMDSNQRSYAWEAQHVTELFQDLAGAIDKNYKEYFLGSIVVTSQDGHVVDGQQRLATTLMLIGAIRDFLLLNGDTGRATQIEREYMFSTDLRTQKTSPRLHLNAIDHSFFVKRILSKPDSADRNQEPSRNKDSHDRIVAAARIAHDWVQRITSQFAPSAQAEKLMDWLAYLEKSARVIWITVPDDANAYTIFETLNDRGADLSSADLLKVNIFNVAGDRLKEAEQRWNEMLGATETVGGEELTKTYIRHLWIAMYGPTRERELLNEIKKKLKNQQDAIDLANALAENAKFYSALLNPKHPHWTDGTSQQLISTLILLGLEQVRPLLLSVVRKFNAKEQKRSLKDLVAWSVRFLIYGGLGGGTLEKNYASRAKSVWDGEITTAKGLENNALEILPSDAEFELAFKGAKASRPHLAKYYLRSLELTNGGQDYPSLIPNDNNDSVSLEHVLPENPSSDWGAIEPDIANTYYKRIGNLALLSTPINNDIGNSGFEIKKPFLAKSEFLLSREISTEMTWGPEEINKRQQRLAQLALTTWPLRA